MGLKVRARGTAMVPRWEALPARRFVGREPVLVDGVTGWAPTSEPSDILDCAEYRGALKDGDLWPADEPTAKLAGVPFDPLFGGAFDLAPAALDHAVDHVNEGVRRVQRGKVG